MDWFTGIVSYFLIWWTALFMVLPFWVRTPDKPEQGHMPGAPENPHLLRKFLVTSVLSAMIWLVVFGLSQARIIDFRAIAAQMVEEDESR
jgi:predicted secreted protein